MKSGRLALELIILNTTLLCIIRLARSHDLAKNIIHKKHKGYNKIAKRLVITFCCT